MAMILKSASLCSFLLFDVAGVTQLSAATDKAPHWGSISAGKAMMRTGPGRNFPAIWEYRRSDLPVKVLESYPNWRKITDPDGATGWVQSNLLSETHTAVVKGGDVRPLRQTPTMDATVLWRVEAGVVGRVSECRNGWCKFDVRGRMGYIPTTEIWGAD
jgi:SH3-like domain-containing protein